VNPQTLLNQALQTVPDAYGRLGALRALNPAGTPENVLLENTLWADLLLRDTRTEEERDELWRRHFQPVAAGLSWGVQKLILRVPPCAPRLLAERPDLRRLPAETLDRLPFLGAYIEYPEGCLDEMLGPLTEEKAALVPVGVYLHFEWERREMFLDQPYKHLAYSVAHRNGCINHWRLPIYGAFPGTSIAEALALTLVTFQSLTEPKEVTFARIEVAALALSAPLYLCLVQPPAPRPCDIPPMVERIPPGGDGRPHIEPAPHPTVLTVEGEIPDPPEPPDGPTHRRW